MDTAGYVGIHLKVASRNVNIAIQSRSTDDLYVAKGNSGISFILLDET